MKNFLPKIDIRRLAGIKTILGIDLDENRACIVEVQGEGIFSRHDSSKKILNAFTVNLEKISSWKEKGDAIRSALLERKITSNYAVSSIQSLGVKTVETLIPSATQNIDEWINENQEKLLKYSVASGRIAHAHEIIEETEQGFRTEICFVRLEDVENYQIAMRQAGLELLGLSIGINDSLNALSIEPAVAGEKTSEILFGYIRDKDLILMRLQDGKAQSTVRETFRTKEELSKLLAQQQDNKLILAGDVPHIPSYEILKPFGYSSEYTLAVGLAVCGFSTKSERVSVLPEKDKERVESSILKSLFQRTTIVLGAIILVLLFLQYSADYIITSKIESLDEQSITNGSAYAEIQSLEKQVQELEQQVYGRGASAKSSQVARFLNDIASGIPEGVWLYRLKSNQNLQVSASSGKVFSQVSLFGYTTTAEKVTDVLRNLNEMGFEIRLMRSGNPLETENLIPVRRGVKFITFEIQVTIH